MPPREVAAPKDPTSRARELYDEHRFGTFGYGDRRERYESLLFEVLAKAPEGAELYDVGCGTGYWLDAYLRSGIAKERITCVDLAPSNVAAIRERGFRALVGDVRRLEVPDAVSDVTVSIGVIHHTDDPFASFAELVRITRPGGRVYLNVYNRLHPYYLLVHRATFPIRWLYWNWTPRVADVALWFARFLYQPLAYLALGRFLDPGTARTMFMDQVMTPRAHLFTKRRLRSWAERCGCSVETLRHNRHALMIAAALRVGGGGRP